MKRLSNLKHDQAAVRKVLKDEFGVNPSENLEMRGHVSDILDAWDEAR